MRPSSDPDPERGCARTGAERSRADGERLVVNRIDHPRAAMHELSERLTAITNYLASSLRLSEIGAAGAGLSPRHTEILGKALGQANQAAEAIYKFRKLLVKESEMQGEHEQAIHERAYALWEQDGRPHGRDLEHWLRAVAEISGEANVGVTGIVGRSPAETVTKPRGSSDTA
jgi:hypothetical protein